MSTPFTYSFLDVQAAISGPGGAISLGSGAGVAEEGITFEPVGDIDGLTIGADGTPMHALMANKGAKVTVRLLKTSPTNALLSAMMAFQRASSANHGQNLLSMSNAVSGDVITCQMVGFAKVPTVAYTKDGPALDWEFNAGIMDIALGAGIG